MLKKLAYSLGAVATAISYQAFSTYLIFFYVDVLKLPVALAGSAILLYGLWNAVNDPLFGFLSDNTRTRWGRRIPYLLAGAIPFGLLFFLLWVPPFDGIDHALELFLYLAILICLFDALYTITVLNWAALFPEMFPTDQERAQVNVFRQSLGMIGLLLGIALPPLFYSTWGWPSMGALFGCLISLTMLIAVWGSRENKAFSRPQPLPFWPALKATLRNRSFLTFVLANLFVQYTFTLIMATIPFFAKYVLNANPQRVTVILAAAFLTAIPMLFVWKRVAVRFGAKQAFLASLLLLALFLTPLFYVQSFGLVVLTAALIGAAMAGFILVADLVIADIIDEDELTTGHRREGMYFGLNAFITRFAIGLEAFSMSAVFIMSGYNPYVFTQYAEFRAGLRFLIAGLPIIALAIGFSIMLFYPLAGHKLAELKTRLAEAHAKQAAS
ncbi:MAG: MFS transporter [Candidatus Margulisiibacteriota bacterium]